MQASIPAPTYLLAHGMVDRRHYLTKLAEASLAYRHVKASKQTLQVSQHPQTSFQGGGFILPCHFPTAPARWAVRALGTLGPSADKQKAEQRQGIFVACSLFVHWMILGCSSGFRYSLGFRWVLAGFSSDLRRMFVGCSLGSRWELRLAVDIRCMFVVHSFDVPWMSVRFSTFAGFSLDSRRIFVGSSLESHWLFVGCSLGSRWNLYLP